MPPYYFRFVTGHGKYLQGYFDWRPKDTDEAVAAASSDDAGFTWTFQQKVLELTKTCEVGVDNGVVSYALACGIAQGEDRDAGSAKFHEDVFGNGSARNTFSRGVVGTSTGARGEEDHQRND